MLLSIIIPIYNLERYIQRCLDSCVEQRLSNDRFEIICVDDGSTDHTCNLLYEYEKNGKIIVIRKENGGVSSARNLGLKSARGEYVWFVDGDDWIRQNCIEGISEQIVSCKIRPDSILFSSRQVREYENESTSIPTNSELIFGGGGY